MSNHTKGEVCTPPARAHFLILCSLDINPSYDASLEAIHDQMHLNVGGRGTMYGHMADPDYAGIYLTAMVSQRPV